MLAQTLGGRHALAESPFDDLIAPRLALLSVRKTNLELTFMARRCRALLDSANRQYLLKVCEGVAVETTYVTIAYLVLFAGRRCRDGPRRRRIISNLVTWKVGVSPHRARHLRETTHSFTALAHTFYAGIIIPPGASAHSIHTSPLFPLLHRHHVSRLLPGWQVGQGATDA